MTTPGIISVRDLGARGDGEHDDTQAVQSALDRAAGTGATVLIPPGIYACRTLVIRSRTTVELAGGATLLGPAGIEGYTPIPYHDAIHEWDRAPLRHFIAIVDAEQVRIRGAGTIAARGWAWSLDGESPDAWRRHRTPRPDSMVAAVRCRDLSIEGITLTDPPNWHLDLYCCDRVRLHGITVASDPRLPNNDGIDISGSRDVTISDCHVDVGDDGIVINGRGRPVSGIAIVNCHLRSQCGAVKVGWEVSRNPISRVVVANCVISGCSRGICAYSCEGATVEDVLVANCVIDTCAPVMFARPIHLDLRRGERSGEIGAMRRFTFSGLNIASPGRILMTCDEAGGHLRDIVLRDVRLALPYLEDPEPDAEGNTSSQFSNRNRAARRARAAVVAEHLADLHVDNLAIAWPDGPVPEAWRIPVKRENGGRRLFRTDYDRPLPCAWSALWARDVSGIWRAPRARASHPEHPAFDLGAACQIGIER